MTESVLALAKSAELVLFCVAIFFLFRRRDYAIAEAAAYAIVTVFLAILIVIQLSMQTGVAAIMWVAEVPALFVSIGLLCHHRRTAVDIAKPSVGLLKHHPLLLSLFCFFMLLLGICSVVDGPGLKTEAPLIHFPLWYAGSDALGLLTKYYSLSGLSRGPGFFSYLAYLAIGFSTYALARRHAWPETAIVVTMIVLSLPRVVYLSTVPGTELLSCATGLFGILCLYRTIEKPSLGNLLFLVAAITIGLCGRLYMVCFSSLLVLLCGLSLYRRHGGAIWIDLIIKNRRSLFILLLATFLTAFALMPVQDTATGSDLSIVSTEPLNKDGIQGTGANAIRYLLTCLNPGQPLDSLFGFFFDRPFSGIVKDIYDRYALPLAGNLGSAEPFQMNPATEASARWFGPFGTMLILPAVLYALLRGSRRLKGIALSLLGYCFLISLVFAWAPTNATYFSLFFVCSGFTVSYLLPPWRLTRKGRILLIATCLVLMVYTALNSSRHLF